MDEQQDDIPAVWQPEQKLTWQDGVAMMSFLGFLLLSVLPGIWVLDRLAGPGRSQNWLPALPVTVTAIVSAAFLCKYVWLLLMARFVGRASVGPLVAYGLPRRISRLDRWFINRHFPPGEPQSDTGANGSKATARLARRLAGAYLFGAALGVALSFPPSLRGDKRLIGLAGFFGVIGLLHLWAERYERRRKPE